MDVVSSMGLAHRTDVSPAPSLDGLLRISSTDMAEVNRVISMRIGSKVRMIPDLAGHLIGSGGKRLRPMLTVVAARLCGYQGHQHVQLAAAVEFMHTATLLHDDVVDDSDLRRGRPAARTLWGNQASVLVGDFLLGQAFQMMIGTGSLAALGILADASAAMAEGEVMQLARAHDLSTTEEGYLEVVNAKTATLFAAAAEVGAAISERGDVERKALREYGTNLGVAFQLIDDALDYSGQQAELGKAIGDDFREGKITLPVLLAFARGDSQQRSFWRRTIRDGKIEPDDLPCALRYIEDHDALQETLARARKYGNVARNALVDFADTEYRHCLLEAVDFCIARAY